MSIYQPKRSRLPMIVGAIGMALVGLAAGYLIWGTAAPDPIEALAPTQAELASAADAIDIVTAHAEFAAEDGADDPDYTGSPEAIDRAEDAYGRAETVVSELNPEAAARITSAFTMLTTLVEQGAPPGEVITAAETLSQDLRDALGT